jgi:hypothetical protein
LLLWPLVFWGGSLSLWLGFHIPAICFMLMLAGFFVISACAWERWRPVVLAWLLGLAAAVLFLVDEPALTCCGMPTALAAYLSMSFASVLPPPAKDAGICEHCGYSLQGLTVPRCPECGTPFPPGRLRAFRSSRFGSVLEEPGGIGSAKRRRPH